MTMGKSNKELIRELLKGIDWYALQDAYEYLCVQWQDAYIDDYTPTERELQMRVIHLAEELLTTNAQCIEWGHLCVLQDNGRLNFRFIHDFKAA